MYVRKHECDIRGLGYTLKGIAGQGPEESRNPRASQSLKRRYGNLRMKKTKRNNGNKKRNPDDDKDTVYIT